MLKWRRQENISLSLFSFFLFFFFSPFKTYTRSFKRGGVSAISKHVSITWYLTSWAINWLTVLQKWETKVWLKRLPDQIRASICPRPNFASSFPSYPGALPDLPVNLSVLLFSLSFRWVLIVGPSKNSSVCNKIRQQNHLSLKYLEIYIYCELQENSSIHFGRLSALISDRTGPRIILSMLKSGPLITKQSKEFSSVVADIGSWLLANSPYWWRSLVTLAVPLKFLSQTQIARL